MNTSLALSIAAVVLGLFYWARWRWPLMPRIPTPPPGPRCSVVPIEFSPGVED